MLWIAVASVVVALCSLLLNLTNVSRATHEKQLDALKAELDRRLDEASAEINRLREWRHTVGNIQMMIDALEKKVERLEERRTR